MQQEPKALNFGGVVSMTGQIWTQKIVCLFLGITSKKFFLKICITLTDYIEKNLTELKFGEKSCAVLEWVVFTPIWAQMVT